MKPFFFYKICSNEVIKINYVAFYTELFSTTVKNNLSIENIYLKCSKNMFYNIKIIFFIKKNPKKLKGGVLKVF